MSAEREKRVTPIPETIEGVHYLVDRYAVLGVPRDASYEDIHASWRTKAAQYAPDRYASLAPEMKRQAELKSAVLNDARAVLENPTTRAVYDQTLAEWDGPISKTGIPVIDSERLWYGNIHRGDTEYMDEAAAEAIAEGRARSGHNAGMLDFVEQAYLNADSPSAELEALYKAALFRKDVALSLEEGFHRETIGLEVPTSLPPSDYLELTDLQLEKGRQKVAEQVEKELLRLGGIDIKLLPSDEREIADALTVNPQEVIAERQKVAAAYYEKRAREIRRVAKEREEVIRKRLSLVKGEYHPQQGDLDLTDKLLVKFQVSDEGVQWFAFAATDNTVQEDTNLTAEELRTMKDTPERVEELLQLGYSVMTVRHEEGLSPEEELNEAIVRHYGDLEAQQDAENAETSEDSTASQG